MKSLLALAPELSGSQSWRARGQQRTLGGGYFLMPRGGAQWLAGNFDEPLKTVRVKFSVTEQFSYFSTELPGRLTQLIG
jgi:hypothetical protein